MAELVGKGNRWIQTLFMRMKYDKHYKDKVKPAYAAAEAYAKNLTYNAKTNQYQGTEEQIRQYIKLSNKIIIYYWYNIKYDIL